MRSVRCAAAALLSILCATWVWSCRPAPAPPPPPPAPAPFVPGLGEIMTLTQMRHLKLWLAIEAGNWDLAAYELDELQEGLADAVAFHPQHKGAPRPLTELVPETMDEPIAALRAALALRDRAQLERAHDALTAGCNACHAAAGFGFNRVVRPSANPYSNQAFEGTPP